MKYFSKAQVLESLSALRDHHPWFGYTYLAAKREKLPVGHMTEISLDALNQMFLQEFYALHPKSRKFFRPLRKNNYDRFWVAADYASSGLQKTNTTTFGEAFLHEVNPSRWGWASNYVDFLADYIATKLQGKKVPAFHLAVWIYRKQQWKEGIDRRGTLRQFFNDFNIVDEERKKLFDSTIRSSLSEEDAFAEMPVAWDEILAEFPPPEDVGPAESGVLNFLEMEGVGPVSPLSVEFGHRLNLITGDNGLGKSFLLEVCWYALTGMWVGYPALPNDQGGERKGRIKFQISGRGRSSPQISNYVSERRVWHRQKNRTTISGLVIYARVDGSYAVWDPIEVSSGNPDHALLRLDRQEIWDGTDDNRIQGLIRDWIRWQDNRDKYPFDTFLKVLDCMAPPELRRLEPGDPIRLPPDTRDFPTLRHPYGDVPITHESAGVQHIVALAYLMVWSWYEHVIKAKSYGRRPDSQMVVLIDEMEVHLHPRWQRVILPALLKVANILSASLETQLAITTHSPLVLASAEPIFDSETDKLFHLEQTHGGYIRFSELPFFIRGDVGAWLTSEIFDLRQPRSREAEKLISEATQLQELANPEPEEIRYLTEELAKVLPAGDRFWPRWVFFARSHGVEL